MFPSNKPTPKCETFGRVSRVGKCSNQRAVKWSTRYFEGIKVADIINLRDGMMHHLESGQQLIYILIYTAIKNMRTIFNS